ncbi:MAG TPA: pyridoxamine 5'-phosphate oxidase family protein [Flavitalea sp.]|nr:pyridoxamine 5'-phosphate oxidase family protein [Flavitalea sp.]
MMNILQLRFLQNKISDIQSALFSNESEAVLKLPTSIINALNVDDAGQIWFFVNRPSQLLQEFDKEFPAKLNFFKKGKDYFLHITGKAYIINDPEEINHLVSLSDEIRNAAINNWYVLVKMRVQTAEYYERHSNKSAAGWNSLIKKMFSWMFDLKPRLRPAYFLQDSAAA